MVLQYYVVENTTGKQIEIDIEFKIYVEKFTSASLICKAFYGKMKA